MRFLRWLVPTLLRSTIGSALLALSVAATAHAGPLPTTAVMVWTPTQRAADSGTLIMVVRAFLKENGEKLAVPLLDDFRDHAQDLEYEVRDATEADFDAGFPVIEAHQLVDPKTLDRVRRVIVDLPTDYEMPIAQLYARILMNRAMSGDVHKTAFARSFERALPDCALL